MTTTTMPVDNRRFAHMLRQHRAAHDGIAEYVFEIATRTGHTKAAIGIPPDQIDDAISHATIKAINAIDKFDVTRNRSPMAYFRQVVWSALRHYVRDEVIKRRPKSGLEARP